MKLKNWWALNNFLALKLHEKGIYVSQRKGILDLLEETRMLGYKPLDTLINPNHKLKII